MSDSTASVIDMVLHCPRCGMQHVDEPDLARGWANSPHRSHLCAACDFVWRVADVCTNGVRRTQTRGQADTPTFPVVVLLRSEKARDGFYPLAVCDGRLVSSCKDFSVGRDRFSVYESPPGSGSLLLVFGHGETNVVNGAWHLEIDDDGCARTPYGAEAKLLGYVEDQMDCVSSFNDLDSECRPQYEELLDAFRRDTGH
jgi:hypothetical protein